MSFLHSCEHEAIASGQAWCHHSYLRAEGLVGLQLACRKGRSLAVEDNGVPFLVEPMIGKVERVVVSANPALT